MIFRQMFDPVSSTYTYLLAERAGGEALLIDPVLEQADKYVTLIEQLGLRLVLAVDTHIHADHVTALGTLRQRTDCLTAMSEMSRAECVSVPLHEGDRLRADGLGLEVLYTPGHTDDSCSLLMSDRVFTGDTLFRHECGRCDLEGGDFSAMLRSLKRLHDLDGDYKVFPGHEGISTLNEERAYNPYMLQAMGK